MVRRLVPMFIVLFILALGIPSWSAAEAADPVAVVWETKGGPDPLRNPTLLALDPAGNLWVTDGRESRFHIFAPDGTFLETWGTPGTAAGQFTLVTDGDGLGGVVFDAAGNFYVADTGNVRVQKFGPDRTFLTAWGSEGNGDGQFRGPWDVALDAAGRVYVFDGQRSDIQVFDGDGEFLFKFAGYGRKAGQLLNAGGLTVAPDGTVWVADLGNNRVQHFSADGAFLETWGRRPFGTEEGAFFSPFDLVVDGTGRVYVTEFDNRRVQVFAPDGRFLAAWGGSTAEATKVGYAVGIALDETGHVYVGDWDSGTVRKFRLLPPLAPTTASDLEAGKELVRGFYDAFNSNDPTILDTIMTEDFVDSSDGSDPTAGRQGMVAYITGTRAEFTDAVATIEDLVAEGDRVAARITWQGHVPAPYEVSAFEIWRVENGRLAEFWALFDSAGFQEQIAPVGTPEATPSA